MTLKEIVQNLKEAKATINLELDSVHPKYRSGVEGRVRQAERSLIELEALYRDTIQNNIMIVALKGKNSGQFAKIADKAMLCINQNMLVNEIYDKISERLPSYQGFSGQELTALLGELNEARLKYGIDSIPPISDNNVAATVASLPLREAIGKILRTNYGFQLDSAAIRRHAADVALNEQYDGAGKLVVGVYNYQGVDALILSEPYVIVDVEQEVTQEFVDETLNKIQESLTVKKEKPNTRNRRNNKGEIHE